MPAPLPDLTRDQQCHFYMAPTGQRCGSPAIKGHYYCYHHHLKNAKRTQQRVLIDPEVTRMELPPIEDRASIFLALAAVVHRLAENTIDTRRAGQMIYGLQVALQALQPEPAAATRPAARSIHSEPQPSADAKPAPESVDSPSGEPSSTPETFAIRKQDLLYFLRSRHCARCNFELFPASELTERRHPGAPPEVIEEARPALEAPDTPAPNQLPEQTPAEVSEDVSEPDASGAILTLHGVAAQAPGAPPVRAFCGRVGKKPGAPPSRAARVRVGGFRAASDTPSPHPAQETASRLPETPSDARIAVRRAPLPDV